MAQPAILALEDGAIFEGQAIGAVGSASCLSLGEVVFNTAMSGYQEILSDPSYANQHIVLTYPHIGNVGVNAEDLERKKIHAKGLIVRALPLLASNWRKQHALEEYLKAQNILGMTEVDTRHLTKHLREKGSLRGCIACAPNIDRAFVEKAIQAAQNAPSMQGCDLAKEVSTESTYLWQGGGTWFKKKPPSSALKVVAYDFGIKHSLLRCLHDLGCQVTVVPAMTSMQEILDLEPDGIFLSNGPGDPEPCGYAIETVQQCLKEQLPMFGVCLGFQIMALALGAKTFKMKFGHHGGNHPVQDLQTQRVLITAQNHGFAVDENTLPSSVRLTHRSLFDGTVQGIQHKHLPVFGFQGHPEAGPGPNDAKYLFEHFMRMMKQYAQTKKTVMEV